MGDLAADTAVVEVGDGRYEARLSQDWEIWGPMGGYVAATALRAVEAASPFRFWENFDSRPLNWIREWPPPGPIAPEWRSWMRFASWDDAAGPWVEAARLLLLCDLPSWPSGNLPHAWREPPFIAPTLDLQVSFVRLAAAEPWLLLEGTTPVGADGMLPFTSRVWTPDGRLLATGGGQTLCRRVPQPPQT